MLYRKDLIYLQYSPSTKKVSWSLFSNEMFEKDFLAISLFSYIQTLVGVIELFELYKEQDPLLQKKKVFVKIAQFLYT